jgi:hypothetical protein
MKKPMLGANEGLNDNAVMKCGITYCKCIIRYFEKFIRFLNSNAYIMIALTGQSFCEAAYDAFYLIMRNLMKVAITHGCNSILIIQWDKFSSSSVHFSSQQLQLRSAIS